MSLIVWQGSSHTAYPNFSDSVGGRSLMYTLKNDGASTDRWGRPFFKIRFRLRNTRKFRWLIILAMSLIVVSHLIAFYNFIMSPACQTVSHATLRSISTAPVLGLFWNPDSMLDVRVRTWSHVLRFFRKAAWSGGMTLSKVGASLVRSKYSRSL